MIDRFQRLRHLVLGEELLHHQKLREMIVAAILQTRMHALPVRSTSPPSVPALPFAPFAGARSSPFFEPVGRDGMPGRLQPRLDIAQHREDLRRVRFLQQNHLALLHRERVGTDVEIGLGQTARDALSESSARPTFW